MGYSEYTHKTHKKIAYSDNRTLYIIKAESEEALKQKANRTLYLMIQWQEKQIPTIAPHKNEATILKGPAAKNMVNFSEESGYQESCPYQNATQHVKT